MGKKDKKKKQDKEQKSTNDLSALGALLGMELEPQEPSTPKQNSSKGNYQTKNQSGGYKPNSQGNKQTFNNSRNNQGQGKTNHFDSRSAQKAATAPYNFVSLPDSAMPSPLESKHDLVLSDDDKTVKKSFGEYIRSGEQISGEIVLDIELQTPLFIGGNTSDKKLSFAPINSKLPILPGSSLRGMFKNIFKIVTCGTMRGRTSTQKKGEDFTDEHIYYRCLMAPRGCPAWMKDLNTLYNDRMTSLKNGKPVKNAKPGFLIKTKDGKYYVAPLKDGCFNRRIEFWKYERDFNDRVGVRDSRVTWHDRNAYCITGKNKNKKIIRYLCIDDINWSQNSWLEFSDDGEVLTSYRNDRNRGGVNLLDTKNKKSGVLTRREVEAKTGKSHPDIETLVSCHFLEKNGFVTAFGHGQCFRIPYKNRIGDAVPKKVNSDIIDFADTLFGRESFWASRVYFEDATPIDEITTQKTAAAHPQMQPNPTSYQLYLKQDGGKLNMWDPLPANGPKPEIRGYKMYWHNGEADWHANAAELELDRDRASKGQESLTKELTPLEKGNKFKTKIRFKNLNEIELGALLMIFDLAGKGQTAAYKLGQGKSMGFGSIKAKPTLYIEDESAYTELFDDAGWKNPYRVEEMDKYLEAFKAHVNKCGMQTIWQKVMDELNAILNWENTNKANWGNKIKAMDANFDDRSKISQFQTRDVLPTILEVVGK